MAKENRGFRFEPYEYEAYQAAANRAGISVSAWVAQQLNAALAQESADETQVLSIGGKTIAITPLD